MKIRLKFEKTNLIRLIVAMIFAAVLYYKVTFPVYVLAGFGACYFLIKSLEIEINNKWLKLALNVVLLGGSSVMTVSFAGCGTSGEDYGHEDVFECPVLFGCLCGRAGVYKKCGADLRYLSYSTDDFCGDQLFCLSVPWK